MLFENLGSGILVGTMGWEGIDGVSLSNKDSGRAMRMTPIRAMAPAICSFRVNGSWRRMAHTQQARVGARNVMTMDSAIGRYRSESNSTPNVVSNMQQLIIGVFRCGFRYNRDQILGITWSVTFPRSAFGARPYFTSQESTKTSEHE